MNKLFDTFKVYVELFKQLGLKYTLFRLKYEFSKKMGFYKAKFPTQLPLNVYLSLDLWKEGYANRFFVPAKEEFKETELVPSELLAEQTKKILEGKIPFFFTDWKDIGFENDWFLHPISKFQYDKVHWTKLHIYDPNAGDIKYVWEKSKFSYLLYLIRNDLFNKEDHSGFTFSEIERWIDQNPPNIGPQYICSQEISIRLLNWCFALFFYQNSKHLKPELFEKILASIEVQLNHVYDNINFSKIAVRNNHAVSETMCLYLISMYFPFLKNAEKYNKLGKKWFEKEIEFQLFEDGSDSQYSFNYHRVKIQLLCWAISSAKANGDTLAPVVYDKARKSLAFLMQMIGNNQLGHLPNFGANDGSIYFKLNDSDYANYLPQLNALASLIDLKLPFKLNQQDLEDEFWFTQKTKKVVNETITQKDGIIHYPNGGYIQIKEEETLTLFKTPELSFRAAQDDLFHLDIWVDGVNVLKDSGSYSYNTDQETMLNFNGVKGHNSVSLNGSEHMLKGPRFTWLYKPVHLSSKVFEHDNFYEFESIMKVHFPYPHVLKRKVRKEKKQLMWTIEDSVIQGIRPGDRLIQLWNSDINSLVELNIEVKNKDEFKVVEGNGNSSVYYGTKDKTKTYRITTTENVLKTIIKITSKKDKN